MSFHGIVGLLFRLPRFVLPSTLSRKTLTLPRASRTSSEQEINFLETSVGIYVRGTAASAAVAAGADAGGGPDADGGSDGDGGRISLPSTCPYTSDDSVLPIETSRVPSP
uniref:Uncharacterized protein n=1 Tax=Vespula pensylvanica TaxID=30213 RepID=A0A834NKN1_VESPE|nr:hypothetical protein H0235_013565 [Vespula pensylvanica]